MENMRHLSTSLPHTRRRRNDAPALLADFKAAALSVTTLYKSAAASQGQARDAGYQDALDDLLAFLDRENLGLMDGEGWRVRQWATERLVDDGRQAKASSDDEAEEEVSAPEPRHRRQPSRSSSPEVSRKAAPPMPISSSEIEDETGDDTRRTAASEPPQTQLPAHGALTLHPSHACPANDDREGGMDLDSAANTAPSTSTSTTENTPTSVRLVPRPHGRARHHHGRRGNTAAPSTTLNFNLGAGAGSKRKVPYQDFFDISGFSSDRSQDGKDGGAGRGGKRGRFV